MIYDFPLLHKTLSNSLISDIMKHEGTVLSPDQMLILIPNDFPMPSEIKPSILTFTPITRNISAITEGSREYQEFDNLTCKTCGNNKN